MNIYEKQLVDLSGKMIPDISGVSNMFSVIIMKDRADDDMQLTLRSLRHQLFLDFEYRIIDPVRDENETDSWNTIVDLNRFKKKHDCMKRALDTARGSYILFLQSGYYLPPYALMTFAEIAKQGKYVAIYADEAVFNENIDNVYQVEIKPDFSEVTFFSHLDAGQAVVWEKETLLKVLDTITTAHFDTVLRECFIRLHPTEQNVFHISRILLLKNKEGRVYREEKKLIPLIEEEIKQRGMCGKIKPSTSYNRYCVELDGNLKFSDISFLLYVENPERSCFLINQLRQACEEAQIVVGAGDSISFNAVDTFCSDNNYGFAVKVIFVEQDIYSEGILHMAKLAQRKIHIVIRDSIQWCNRADIYRLIQIFSFPEVSAASPQIATATTKDGTPPKMVYAGASVKDASFYTPLFKGRLQNIYGELDPVWTNRKIEMLSSFCYAMKADKWDYLSKLHYSIQTPEQLVIELSLKMAAAGKTCVYAAQSSFWLGEGLNGTIDSKTLKKTDCHWHWLCHYGSLLESLALRNNWMYRSWRTHLNTDFRIILGKIPQESVNRRILVYTHELSLTGAPIVLLQAVRIMLEAAYNVVILSPMDGPLRKQCVDMGIPVIIDPMVCDDSNWLPFAADFDMVLVNTVVPFRSIEALGETKIRVLWWLHDSRMGYRDWLRFVLPKEIGDNIHTYAVSPYAKKVMQDYRPAYEVELLPYGIEDYLEESSDGRGKMNFDFPDNRIVFANIGQILERKGQDVLIKAISNLGSEIIERCYFVFVGSVVDKAIYVKLEKAIQTYPDHIRYIEKIPHENMKDLYGQVDVVVCSSRDDPLPTFITEAMIGSRLCICSENTGFLGMIENGVNGFLYQNDDDEELAKVISYVVKNFSKMDRIAREGRRLYEDILSERVFRTKLLKTINNMLTLN